MAAAGRTLRVCAQGHHFYKSSDSLVCPVCEAARQLAAWFLPALSRPARRALENKGIDSLQRLAEYTEKEIVALHGIGKAALPKTEQALN